MVSRCRENPRYLNSVWRLVDTPYKLERIKHRVVVQRPPLESGENELLSNRKQMNQGGEGWQNHTAAK
jgi:hypothetical protein